MQKFNLDYKFIVLKKYFLIFAYTFFDYIFISFGNIFKKQNIDNKFKIITASDTSHYLSLRQLLDSIVKYEKDLKVIVYDLGLSDFEVSQIKNEYKTIELKKFEFNNYPKYFLLSEQDKGAYAWKPAIIYEEFIKDDSHLIWMDAGNLVTKPLKLLKKIIINYGFFSPLSSEDIKKWTHIQTLKNYNFPDSMLSKRNLNAALIGFKSSQENNSFVTEWKELAFQKDFILPDGANRDNHRWDQSLLTLIYYKKYMRKYLAKTNNIFGIKIHQDVD